MRAPTGAPGACRREPGAAAFRAAARKVTGPGPRVPGRRPQSGPRDTWPHILPRVPLTSQHRGAASRTHGDAAAAKPRGAPGRPPAAAPSAASSSPPQTPTRGGAKLLAEGGRRRRLAGTDKARQRDAPPTYTPSTSSWRRTSSNQPRSVPAGRRGGGAGTRRRPTPVRAPEAGGAGPAR